MRMLRRAGARWAFTLAAVLAASAPATADVSAIDVDMYTAASRADATGALQFRIPSYVPGQPSQATLTLTVAGLPSGRRFALEINAQPEASFWTDAAGAARLELDVLVSGGTRPLLPVDPRGKLVTVTGDGGSWLAAVLSGPLEPPGIVFDEAVRLVRAKPPVLATVRYHRDPSSAHFEVQAVGLPAGGYAVLVDGSYRGSMRAEEGGTARLDLPHPSFDPRNRRVEIVGVEGRVLGGTLRASLPTVSPPQPASQPVSLGLRIPDFFSNQVVGVSIWRMDDDASTWRVVERIFFWGPRAASNGGEVLDTSRIDPISGVVLSGRTGIPIAREGDAVTLSLDFARPLPAADFKVSTFNQVGESLRSQAAARR